MLNIENVFYQYDMILKNEKGINNYKPCYDGFINYMKTLNYLGCNNIKDLFEKITIVDIRDACAKYYECSDRTSSTQAIHRFLLAMDSFNEYFLKANGIRCNALEQKINTKDNVRKICNIINIDIPRSNLFQSIDKKTIEIAKEKSFELKEHLMIQLQQKIIFELLCEYGFKETRILNIPINSFDAENHMIHFNTEDGNFDIVLKDDIYFKIVKLCEINKYKERKYLFCKNNGEKATSSTILYKLSDMVKKYENCEDFCPTTVGLYGVTNLINRNFNISEICLLTGFDVVKIKEVYDYVFENANDTLTGKLNYN